MTKEAKKVFDKFFKIHRDNVAGKTICFISRGEWSDPQIAYKGYLLNYWDVYELACPEDAPDAYEPGRGGMVLRLYGFSIRLHGLRLRA